MKQIRGGMFETNSSSTHSLMLVSEKQFNLWAEGKVYFNDLEYEFLTFKQLQEICRQDLKPMCPHKDRGGAFEELTNECKDCLYDYDVAIRTYDDFFNEDNDEYTFEEHETTPKGEEVVVFGSYDYS